MLSMKCPVCRATYRSGDRQSEIEQPSTSNSQPSTSNSQPSTSNPQPCRRCGVDLSPLIRLHDQAVWYHRQAIQALQAGNYSAAADWNEQAIALNSHDADFHALAGRLSVLQGEFGRAIASFQKVQQLDPKHPTIEAFLQCFSLHP